MNETRHETRFQAIAQINADARLAFGGFRFALPDLHFNIGNPVDVFSGTLKEIDGTRIPNRKSTQHRDCSTH